VEQVVKQLADAQRETNALLEQLIGAVKAHGGQAPAPSALRELPTVDEEARKDISLLEAKVDGLMNTINSVLEAQQKMGQDVALLFDAVSTVNPTKQEKAGESKTKTKVA
jgi:hypothetical protein